jgi:hypothetical protein
MTYRWTASTRLIADQIDRARWRLTLTFRPVSTFSLGLEYNPLSGQVSPLANWLLVQEGARRPAVMLGTSSDRIGTPFGQSYYLTAAKDISTWVRFPLAPYAGAAYGTFDDRYRAIGGFSSDFTERWNGQAIFDGVHLHWLLSYRRNRHVFSGILVNGHDPGVSYSFVF